MAENITASPEQMGQAAQKITNMAQQYEQEYKNLYKDVNSMAGKWEGSDNEAFVSKVAEFENDFQKMKSLMDDYANFLQKTKQQYEQTQENVAKQAKSLSGGK